MSDAPTFPFTFTVGDQSITLHADGHWTGNLPAFRKAAAELKGQGTAAILLWLLLRELERADDALADAPGEKAKG